MDRQEPKPNHLVDGNSSANEFVARTRFMSWSCASLFVIGWVVWFWPFDDWLDRSGTPFGGDFPMFYISGRMLLEGASDQLYDQGAHQERLHALFPNLSPTACLPFRYPPIVSIVMAPLAALPYPTSFALFSFLSLAALTYALYASMQLCNLTNSKLRRIVFQSWIFWPVTLETLLGGQASFFACAIVAAVAHMIVRGKWWVAGMALSLALYKPNVCGFILIGILLRYPRCIPGAGLGLVAILVPSIAFYGLDGLVQFGQMSAQLATETWLVETPYWKQHGLSGWLAMMMPGQERAACLLTGFAATVLTVTLWYLAGRGRGELLRGLIALVLVNSLFNPYTPIYDLSLLGLAAYWFIEARSESESIRSWTMVYCAWGMFMFGPHLSQALSKHAGAQVLSLVLVAVLVRQWWELVGRLWVDGTAFSAQPASS